MGTIDKYVFEQAGANGCSNSDYNLGLTTCCHKFVVEDDELLELYFDPEDLNKHIDLWSRNACPLCGSAQWNYELLEEWPKDPNVWQWAFHPDPHVVAKWQRN